MEQELSRCGCCEPSEELTFPGGASFALPNGDNAATVVEVGDAAADDTTDASMELGDTFDGSLGTTGDEDWIAIDLNGGETIEFTLDSTFNGGQIDVYDSNGTLVASATGGFGSDPEAVLDVPASGTYYVSVSQSRDRGTGDYTLSANTYVPPSPLESIDWGGVTVDTGGTDVVQVYFAGNGETFDGVTSEGFNAYEISQFEKAFDAISAISGLEFEIVGSSAGADFNLVGDNGSETSGFYGYFNPPGERNEGVGVFNTGLWDRTAGGDLEVGGWGFVTIIHELGHGIGMAHPHDNGGGSDVMNGVTSSTGSYGDFDLNQGVYTMMSYNSGAANYTPMPAESIWGYEMGPMALDIALLQQKYGANTTTNSGDDVYEVSDATGSGNGWLSIWDTGGTDTMVYNGSNESFLDLREATLEYEEAGGGWLSHVDGISAGFSIANGVVIENAEGGDGRDWLLGNQADNTLEGGNGDDALRSFFGDDYLDGGNGADFFAAGKGADTMIGGADADTFLFKNVWEAGTADGERDRILDFEAGLDTLNFFWLDADTSTSDTDALTYIAGAAFTGGGHGELQLISEDGIAYDLLSVDGDGDGVADMSIEVYSSGLLTIDDIVL